MEKHKPDEGIDAGITPTKPGYFWIDIRPDHIIFVEPTGYITGEIVEHELTRLKDIVAGVQSQGYPVLILVSINKITGHTTESRSAIKRAAELPFKRGAAYGGSIGLGLIMQYLQRSIDPTRARYFRSEQAALAYLRDDRKGKRPNFRTASRRSIILSTLLLLFFASVTYLGWTFSNQQLASESKALFSRSTRHSLSELQRRMDVYVQALYGFRGLFNASNSVERNEFDQYFKSLNLPSEYPGFNAISYVRHVNSSDLAKFSLSVRTDKSLNGVGYPDFTVHPSSSTPSHDVVTYVEPLSAATNFGLDFSTDPVRLKALETARDSGKPTATATITFQSAPKTKGFLIALPIYSRPEPTTTLQRQQQLIGYVNAVFRYNTLFTDVFSGISEPDTAVTIEDGQGQEIYSEGTVAADGQTVKSSLKLEGQNFTLIFKASPKYGLSETSLRLPRNVLSAGIIVVVMLLLLLVTLLRTRSQATKLAATMTADLENERNVAIENERKLEISEKALAEEKDSVERKVVERTQQLNEARAQLEASLRGLPFGFAIINGDGNGVFSNQALQTILGRAIPVGADHHQTISQIETALQGSVDVQACLHETVSTLRPVSRNGMLGSKYLRALFIPILETEATIQKIVGTVIILEDVTEEKALQRSRDEFFSIASHELRTPLTAMYGNASMILDTYQEKLDDPALKQMVTDIATSSKRLIDIVKDFLNVSELEQGKANITKTNVDIASVIADAVNEHRADADKRNIELKVETPSPTPNVLADVSRVKQIINNLLSNALRYTQTGSIALQVTTKNNVALIAVSDTGAGIPVEMQHLLFHKFQQASESILTRESSQSTGLGLYISKLLAELMGGKLYLQESEVGKGTTFILELPVATN